MGDRIKQRNELERTERQARVRRAVASVRLENLETTEAAKAAFDHYISGDLSASDLVREIRAVNAREFGPVHVSGD